MIATMFIMIFLVTSWVMGWKIVTAEDMALERIGEWGKRQVEKGYGIFNGLIVCQWCLPNIHGLIFVYPLAFAMGVLEWWDWRYLAMYPFVLGASSFLSGNLWDWYLRNNSKKKLLDIKFLYFDKKNYLLEDEVEYLEARKDDKTKEE